MKNVIFCILIIIFCSTITAAEDKQYFTPWASNENVSIKEYICEDFIAGYTEFAAPTTDKTLNREKLYNIVTATVWVHGYFSGRLSEKHIPLTSESINGMMDVVGTVCLQDTKQPFIEAVKIAADLSMLSLSKIKNSQD